MIDCLIVGQGLAGTCLAVDLIERGMQCLVYDPGSSITSSRIAAGVMNPVTGRRHVKTWQAEVLWQKALQFYRWLADSLESEDLCVDRTIWQVLPDAEAEERWLVRTGDPDYHDYLDADLHALSLPGLRDMTCGKILNARQTDLPYLVHCGRQYLDKYNALRAEQFRYSQLEIKRDHVQYGDVEARNLVFAEGRQVLANPYFNWLPMRVTRGELLVCRIPDLHTDAVIKGPVSIVPMEGDLYWVGSTYVRDPEHASPSAQGMSELRQGLERMVDGSFTVEHHLAAIRPNTRDRRPLVGAHPELSNLFVLNGFGAKGASLAPYCTQLLSAHLRQRDPIPAEVDILRHWPR
ncbi:MAG: FAD-dependent oxidoreductase [Saprospiraceae bacterium]|nr:FAD-dependent oxidoreductase [Saprospiraceae bacterium]